MAHDRTQTPRPVDRPEPGYYATRHVKGGPLLGFRIVEDAGLWFLFANGAVLGKPHADPWKVDRMMETVAFARRIDQAEYQRLLGAAAIAGAADPRAKVDLANTPPLYRRKESP